MDPVECHAPFHQSSSYNALIQVATSPKSYILFILLGQNVPTGNRSTQFVISVTSTTKKSVIEVINNLMVVPYQKYVEVCHAFVKMVTLLAK